jgi:probable HAF family extracellular repeat protein
VVVWTIGSIREDTMKWNLVMAITVLGALTITVLSVAQEQPVALPDQQYYSRYRLVDLGTFGGAQSYVPDGIDITQVRILNNHGSFVGWADTSTPDPYPEFCFDEDCFVAHAFRSRNGVSKRDLGVLPGGASSDTSWIADNGLISGDSQNGEIDPLVPGLPEVRAVLWRHGQMIDLGTLEGGYESVSTSVNSRGHVTGFATNTVADPNSMIGIGYQTRAFVWHNGAMRDLGTLGSGTDAIAGLINEHGQAVGWSYTDSNPSDICAVVWGFPLSTGSFLWEEGKGMTDLGDLGGTCTVATSLNERGQVVGQAWLTGDLTGHAFRWDRKNGLVDLGTLGGDFSSAHAINDKGEAVGGSYLSDNVRIDAALWNGSTAIDMGTVDSDDCSYALSINAVGQVVGISGPGCVSTRAFLWQHGKPMVDLNSLVSSNSSIYVTFAFTINDRGEIAGSGVLPNGDEHAVLLVPCQRTDENCTTDTSTGAVPRPSSGLSEQPSSSVGGHKQRSRLLPRPSSRSRVPGMLPVPSLSSRGAVPSQPTWQPEDAIALRERDEILAGSISISAATSTANSCPAVRCSQNHTAGSICGFRLCRIPGFVQPVWKAFDKTYNRACFYGC